MAKKLVPIEGKEVGEILAKNLYITANSSPCPVSSLAEKLMRKEEDDTGIYLNFEEVFRELRSALKEFNTRNPDIKVDFTVDGINTDSPLTFLFTLRRGINQPQPE